MKKLPKVQLLLAIAAVAWSRLGAADTLPVIQCQPGQPDCIPTAQECAGGGRDGIYYYGSPDRPVGICVGAAGHDIFYLGGNPAKAGCGGIMVADQLLIGNDPRDPSQNPNNCVVFDQSGETPVSGPSFANYPAAAEFAGETSIGVDRRTNAVMFLNNLVTYRVTFDDSHSPATADWKDVSYFPTDIATGDPILWTDPATGRTIVSQAVATGGTSTITYTDDDGDTWHVSQPPVTGMPFSAHETVGGGPYAAPAPPRASSYPSAVYYCAANFDWAYLGVPINVTGSQCFRSDDGGLTWGPPVVQDQFQCAQGPGHVAVGPNGTVAAPFAGCYGGDGLAAIIASGDNGLTWEFRTIPGTPTPIYDPAIAFDAAGRLYFLASLGGKALVTTSDDAGKNWTVLTDVGAPFGIQTTNFAMAVGGDPGRAAVGFYGTTTPGDPHSTDFTGVWHLYVATTIDGGSTWQTVDATPDDPVQRGCMTNGSNSPCPNLKDFQGMTVDSDGRILVGYADGCTSATCVGPGGTPADSHDSRGTIARQVSGDRLLTGSPGPEPPPPPPLVPPPPPPSCTPGVGDCFPTPEQCATGNYEGYWPGGPTGRAGICVGGAGHVVLYAGGNANTPCGAIIVADHMISGDEPQDPNECP